MEFKEQLKKLCEEQEELENKLDELNNLVEDTENKLSRSYDKKTQLYIDNGFSYYSREELLNEDNIGKHYQRMNFDIYTVTIKKSRNPLRYTDKIVLEFVGGDDIKYDYSGYLKEVEND